MHVAFGVWTSPAASSAWAAVHAWAASTPSSAGLTGSPVLALAIAARFLHVVALVGVLVVDVRRRDCLHHSQRERALPLGGLVCIVSGLRHV